MEMGNEYSVPEFSAVHLSVPKFRYISPSPKFSEVPFFAG
jgi:hypothetical protein